MTVRKHSVPSWISSFAASCQTHVPDPARILINRPSAGGLAAGVAFLCRDRKGPKLLIRVLSCRMMDDRSDTGSALQFVGVGVWDRERNIEARAALPGDQRNTENVSIGGCLKHNLEHSSIQTRAEVLR